jgi:putative ABC transport system substrate-binding protein
MSNKKNSQRLLSLFTGVVIIALLLSGCGGAQEARVYRVGVLNGFSPFSELADGFKAGLTDLGYVEGQNITYDIQNSNFDPAQERRILEQFVADEVDLIYAFATESAITAKEVTQGTNIPVVFAFAVLEENELVQNVREPGGNVTGVRFPGPDLSVKRLELLHELAPQVTRVGIIYNQNYPANKSQLVELGPAASSMGLTLVEIPVATVSDIQADLEARAASDDVGIDGILIITDDLSQSPDGWPMISQFAAEHNLPIAGSAAFEADAGAVLSYIPNYLKTGILAAPLADKIFKGTPPGSIPVLTPESSLRINYKVAQELGLTVPEGLLKQADEIIR